MAAKPPDTMSYWGQREYFSLVYNFSFRKKWISKMVAVNVDEGELLWEALRKGVRVKLDSRTTRLPSSELSFRFVTRANSPSQLGERGEVPGVCKSSIRCLGYLITIIILWIVKLTELA